MRRGWFWGALGIAPTSDRSAIRRAYANRLRAIDPDQDPQGFMTLREVRDLALAAAADVTDEAPAEDAEGCLPAGRAFEVPVLNVAPPPNDGILAQQATCDEGRIGATIGELYSDVAGADGGGDPVPGDAAFVPPLVALSDDIVPGSTVAALREATDGDIHPRRIVELLLPEPPREEPLTGDEEAELLAHFEAMLADPRMSEIGYLADAEEWFSHVLAQSSPWSDPIVVRAGEHFGWLADAGALNQTPAVAFVVGRIGELRFLADVQSPRHKHHRAWRELTRPADETSRRGFGVGRRRVAELLMLVRRTYPGLENHLDWYRVAMWENPPRFEFKNWWVGVLLVVAVQFAGAIARNFDRDNAPSSVFSSSPVFTDGLSDPDADIDQALSLLFGGALKRDVLQRENPALYQLLRTNWTIAREAGRSRTSFAQSTGELLISRYRAALGRASYPLLADHRRLMLEEAKVMAASGWQECADFFSGESPGTRLPDALIGREHELIARALVEVKGDLPEPPREWTFSLPGHVVKDAAGRADLPPATLGEALRNEGSARNQCKARIALGEAVLALPDDEGLALLRKL